MSLQYSFTKNGGVFIMKKYILLFFCLIIGFQLVGTFAQTTTTGRTRVTNYNVTVNSNVAGAQILINGAVQTTVTNTVFQLAGGAEYTIEVKAANYQPFSTKINLTADATVTATLQPLVYTVAVNSNVAGASVAVNGTAQKGGTPINLSLAPGTYTIAVNAAGYKPYSTSVAVSANTTVNATLELLLYSVTINSNVAGAAVSINGAAQKGGTPFTAQLAPGSYTIALSLAGYKPYSTTLAVSGNATVNATMEVMLYSVAINSNVAGAAIAVNGAAQKGGTPLTLQLPQGSYTIALNLAGYKPYSTTLAVSGNATVNATLEPMNATVNLVFGAQFINLLLKEPESQILVYVDNKQVQSDFVLQKKFDVSPGKHLVKIVSGGLSYEKEFSFDAGKTYKIELRLDLILQ